MPFKKHTRPAHPPGRARRAARLLLVTAASATSGVLADVYGDTHLITAAGITLAVFPLLLKLVPADSPGDELHPVPHNEHPGRRNNANCPSSSSALAGRPHLPRQRERPRGQTTHHENGIDLGDFTTPPLNVRMTVRPVLNLTTDIAPIVTVRQPTDPDNEGM